MLLLVACNSKERQCERLATTWNGLHESVSQVAVAGAPTKSALDQTIFRLTFGRAELAALDLPDVEIDSSRRALTRLLDSGISALRAFAEVSGNHDAADVWELQHKAESIQTDERKVVDELNRHCQGTP